MGNKVAYDKLPRLDGKVAVVTGASGGIGEVTAAELARKGASVVMLGRDLAKTEAAAAKVREETKNERVTAELCDLMDLSSVNAFADRFLARNIPLNILVNNAGIMCEPTVVLSKDGIESQMATNHFSHFLLTQRLLPTIVKSQPARIVNVSSALHNLAPKDGIHFDELNDEKKYSPWTRYGESKLANIFFTVELQRRLAAAGHQQVFVNCCHPGVIKTGLAQRSIPAFFRAIMGPFIKDPSQGAYTQTYLAASSDITANEVKGRYYVPYAEAATPTETAQNADYALATYEWTEKILREKLGEQFRSFV